MNTERTVVLENTGICPIGLADTQRRIYRLGVGAKMRISAVTLQDILDYPASKILFTEGKAKVSNITAEELYNMGLTEEEIVLFLKDPKKPTVVITENLEEVEEIKEIEEVKEEEIKEEEIKEEKKPTTKKPTTKKTTTKKTTTKKAE